MLQLFHIPFKIWMQSDFHFHEIALQKHETKVGLSKHIRWPDPLGDLTRTDPKPADPTYYDGRQ